MKFKEVIYADRWVNGSGFETQWNILNSQNIEFNSLEDVLKISRHDYDDYFENDECEDENKNYDTRIIVHFYDDNDNVVHSLEWWMNDAE